MSFGLHQAEPRITFTARGYHPWGNATRSLRATRLWAQPWATFFGAHSGQWGHLHPSY